MSSIISKHNFSINFTNSYFQFYLFTYLAVYNNEGHLSASKQDVCDCMSQECPGCHFPCMRCGSSKCGVECRCNRKWQYLNKKEVDGNSDCCLTTTEIQRTVLIPLDDNVDYLFEDPNY